MSNQLPSGIRDPEPARPLAIFQPAADAAFIVVPAFRRLHAIEHSLTVDERPIAGRTKQLRRCGFRRIREECGSVFHGSPWEGLTLKSSPPPVCWVPDTPHGFL